MDPQSKRLAWVTSLLAGLVLLARVAGLFLTFVPFVFCLTILSCSGATTQQAMTPEEVFAKIEESIQRARTVTIRARCWDRETEGQGYQQRDMSLYLLLAQGNRAYATMHVGKIGDFLIVSDGGRLKTRVGQPIQESISTAPEGLAGQYRFLVTRSVDALLAGVYGCGHWPDPDESSGFILSDFRIGEGSGSYRTLTYSIKPARGLKTIRLWYDPRNFNLARREIADGSDLSGHCFAESFDEFTLNADIPDEKFKLPEEKK